MVSRVAAWILALNAASALAGCGKSEGGAGQPVPQSELPAKVADLLCDSVATCCQNGGFAFDTGACKTDYTQELEENLSEYDPSRVAYDAQAAGDCLATVGSKLQCGELEEDDVPACQRIFRGKVLAGQPCNESQECADIGGKPARCSSEDGLTEPVCSAATASNTAARGKLGQACIGTCFEGDECDFVGVLAPAPGPGVPVPQAEPALCYRDDGLFCNAGTCAALLEVGVACNDYAACRGTAFCDFDRQVCAAPRANGEPCQSSSECQSDNCLFPDGPTDPSLPSTPAVCGSAQAVTAEKCANDFVDEPPQAAGDPGQPAPTP